ncbi:MAG: DedA family protein [Rhodobacteraceae bacterium]|jgi:membrane protein YqaA with SNARE-associated domain|nr:DedA family protein [Paracoccaceae bacterium]
MAYVSLFFSALIAATVFPAQSEMVLVYLVQQAAHPVWALVVVASIGNVLGSVINYALGYSVHRFKDRRWFPASPKQMDRAQAFYAKWGRYSLLASWVPIIGDPITVVAGVLRDRFLVFLILVAIAKSGRYVVLAYAFA